METSFVFDFKRYAINDGPGIRMVVFLKGCNLNCAWCHNPESISATPERMYAQSKCIQCGTCVMTCPEKAISLIPDGIITDAERCKLCGHCANVCPTKAIEMSGEQLSLTQILGEIEKERLFFDQSGGGVTFSGGEPLQQHQILIQLLDECKKRGIHTVVDTAGLAKTAILLEVAKRTDLFLFDLKIMNSEKHRKWTGVPNENILKNLRILAETGAKILIRIPLIGGVNDDEENLTKTAKFISELSGEMKVVNFLPYHPIAQTKYLKLGRSADFIKLEKPTEESMIQAISIFGKSGINASVGE
jgi:pyruvate formate lyase activating enzyme